MTLEQRKKYEWYLEIGWYLYEEFPAAGIIIMRYADYIGDSIAWQYLTITKNGTVKRGRHAP